MIDKFRLALKGFTAICRKESAVLSDVNDLILQANTLLRDYKSDYDSRLEQLEESVQALYQALPDKASDLGINLEMEMAVRGLGTIESWEGALDMTSFAPYEFDEIPELTATAVDPESVERVSFDVDKLSEVFDLLERLQDPTVKEEGRGLSATPAGMVMIHEEDLLAMINTLKAHLPAR
jgi:hypothetical protein